jgi:hypothetical protein
MMAKQAGSILLVGSVSGVNFYKTRDGHLARKKSRLDKKKWLRDPAFKGQREASRILGEGAKAYKLLKHAFHPYMAQAADSRQAGRGSALFAKMIRLDSTNGPIGKELRSENLHLLNKWEANKHVSVEAVLNVLPRVEIDRAAGTLTMALGEYSPKNHIAAPAGATHYQLISAVASVDFTAGKCEQERKETQWLAIDKTFEAESEEVFHFTAGTEVPVMAGIGVRFSQRVNEKEYVLNNMQYNAFQVTAVFT